MPVYRQYDGAGFWTLDTADLNPDGTSWGVEWASEPTPVPPRFTGHPTRSRYPLPDLYACQYRHPRYHMRGCEDEASEGKAEGTLHGPDGAMIPGGYYCRRHGEAAIQEYWDKLGESWYFVMFDGEEDRAP